MALDPHEILQGGSSLHEVAPLPLGGTRQQRLQRLQVGLLGLGAVLLLVGLANIIISSARESEVAAVTDLPPATAEDLPQPKARDPLADAGVAPDLLTEEEQRPDSAAGNDGTQLVPID
jgi:hypothetical protein